MLESTLQSNFIKQVKKHNLGLAVKVDSSSRRGWPDITYVDRHGRTHYLEFKKQGGQSSRHQQQVHEELTELGADIRVVTGEHGLNNLIAEFMN